jgi:hypothetical protein
MAELSSEVKRISSLPTFLECPSSELPAKYPYDPISDVADMGNAGHLALCQHVLGQNVDLNQIAAQYKVSVDELEAIFRSGTAAWLQLKHHFPAPMTEVALVGKGIKGHSDVVHADPERIVVLDWKTNRVKRDYRAQVTGYAAAAVEKYGMPETESVHTIIVWLRFGEYDIHSVSADDIRILYDDIEAATKEVGRRYGPGATCTYCRRQLECGARTRYLQSAAKAIAPLATVELNADLLPRFYDQAKLLKKALAHYDQALKLYLKEHGPAADGNGAILELAETKRDKIVGHTAWPILREAGFTDDDFAYVMSMGKTKILEIVGTNAAKGHGAKMKARLMAKLRDAGAVLTTVSESVLARKTRC